VFLANRLTDLLEGLFEDGVMRESGVTLLVTMEGMEFRIAVTKTGVETVTRAATAQEKARAALRQYLHLSSDSAEQTRARVEELLDLAGL
jgi:hypothetical protein